MNSLPRAFVVERVFQAVFAGGIALFGTRVGLPGLLLAAAPLMWLIHTAAVIALAVEVRRGTGDTLVDGGARISQNLLNWTGRAVLTELGTYLGLLALIVVYALVGGQPGVASLSTLVLTLEVLFFRAVLAQNHARRLGLAIRDRRPDDAIAATRNTNLALPHRVRDAERVAEAWLMRGDSRTALEVLAPHRHDRSIALRDAWIRLHHGDPIPAAVWLDQKPGPTPFDQAAYLAFLATVAVSEGRGANVLPKRPEIEAVWAFLPAEYGDPSRLAFAAAAAQAGENALATDALRGLGRPLSDYAYLAHTAPAFWRWVEAAAGRQTTPPRPTPQPHTVAPVWAPPASENPRIIAPVSPLDGLQPVPGLATGPRHRPLHPARRIAAAALLIPILAWGLLTFPR